MTTLLLTACRQYVIIKTDEREELDMKLYDLLRAITHQNYNVVLKDVNFMNDLRAIEREELKNYLDYTVESIDEDWTITIKTQRLV